MAATSEPLGDWDPSKLSPTGVGITPRLPNSSRQDFQVFCWDTRCRSCDSPELTPPCVFMEVTQPPATSSEQETKSFNQQIKKLKLFL